MKKKLNRYHYWIFFLAVITWLFLLSSCEEKISFGGNDVFIYDLDKEFTQFQYRKGITYQDELPEKISDRINLIFFTKKETEKKYQEGICRFKSQPFTTVYTLVHTSGIRINDYCED